MKRILRNGVAAGVAAGIALALVLAVLGEGAIGEAIELEEARAQGQGHEETFTRSTQMAGGALGALLYGGVLGVVFAVAFAALRHRVSAPTDLRRSLTLATFGWLGVVAVPFVLYPPVPPGIGDPDDVSRRTAGYLIAICWGLLAVVAARLAARSVERRARPEAFSFAAAIAAFIALVTIAALMLPDAPSASALPADLVWSFRLSSLAGTTACWLVLGLVFGGLAVRAPQRQPELVGA